MADCWRKECMCSDTFQSRHVTQAAFNLLVFDIYETVTLVSLLLLEFILGLSARVWTLWMDGRAGCVSCGWIPEKRCKFDYYLLKTRTWFFGGRRPHVMGSPEIITSWGSLGGISQPVSEYFWSHYQVSYDMGRRNGALKM